MTNNTQPNKRKSGPSAKKIPIKHLAHGKTRHDDYHWLRQKEDPETIRFLEEWNEHSQAYLEKIQPLSDALYSEFVSRIEQNDQTAPFQIGSFSYYIKITAGKEHPLFCRTIIGKDIEEVILEGNEWAAREPYFCVKSWKPSGNGRFIAFMIDTDGSQYGSIYIKDMHTGQFIHDEILPKSTKTMVWNSSCNGLWYCSLNNQLRAHQVLFHQMGTPPKKDRIILEENDNRYNLHIVPDKLERFIALESSSKDTSEVKVGALNDPAKPLATIKPKERGLKYHVLFGDQQNFLAVSKDRSNWGLYSTVQGDWNHWKEERKSSSVDIVKMETFENHLALILRSEGLLKIQIKNLSNNQEHYILLPQEICDVNFSHNEEYKTNQLRFTFVSPVTPEITYQYNMDSRTLTILKQKKAGNFDPELYTTKRIWAIAQDGVKVPISICHRKDIALNGKNPLYLDAYGSYGISQDPYFSNILASFLERGVICAIAHVRGGGDLGRDWYKQGSLFNKMNTFTDFINCAEHLFKTGYTSPDLLAIHGGSAGGLLMAVVVNMRPDLCKVCLAEVPFVDVLTTMFDESLPLTTEEWEEWGDPNDQQFYEYMAGYSPYDNIQRQKYPAMLITAGLNDAQVSYHEPAKYVAKLLEYHTGDAPILFLTIMGAGHHGASGRFEAYKEAAPEFAFLLNEICEERTM